VSQDQWTAVDQYINNLIIPSDPELDAVLEISAAAGLPPISVTPAQGKLLHLLARIQGARRILEIGTLAGYSTIWLARALPPNGRMITLESDPGHAEIARANIARAGLADRIDVRLGAALETLPRLVEQAESPFDLTFIDADRQNLPAYFEWALKLSRLGSVILVDNVVRKGGVVDAASTDPNIIGVRRFGERLAAETRVSATMVQTVGAKGYDGFAIALVTEDPGGS
jgi:predicted O-methyltransferase YrrM